MPRIKKPKKVKEPIRLRMKDLSDGSNYYYYIFSKGGFTDGLLQAQERGEVKLITLEDLYS